MDETSNQSFGLSKPLPGFRFKPNEEELLSFYLKNAVYGKQMHVDIIGFVNIYHFDPWDLPELAKIKEREWYFFVPRDRKHSNGGRPNRTTKHGFWKATGSDRKIVSLSEPKRVLGLRKTLVFYQGRAPRGCKTDWVMNEYRLPDNCVLPKEIVLCKIYRKATSLKELEERAAKEEAAKKSISMDASYPTSPISLSNDGTSSYSNGPFIDLMSQMANNDQIMTNLKKEVEEEEKLDETIGPSNCEVAIASNKTIQLPLGESLGPLQVPKLGMDWSQDPFGSQSCSPWFENLLNFSSPTILLSQFLST